MILRTASSFFFLLSFIVVYSQSSLNPVPILSDGNPLGYLEYLPANYSEKDNHPVILFWHGMSGSGNGNSELSNLNGEGLVKVIANGNWPVANQQGFYPAEDFIVIAPQSPNSFPSPSETGQMIAYILSKYKADTNRIYLTGLSAGANATWASLVYHHEKIAAAIPIGSNAEWTAQHACNFGQVPIWAFQGADDRVTATQKHINAVNAVNACEPAFVPQAKITIYENIAHGGWNETYSLSGMNNDLDSLYAPFDKSIYDWLLQFTLNNRDTVGGPSNLAPIANAGSDITIYEGQTASLDGTDSRDGDGSIAQYAWRFIGDNNVFDSIFVDFNIAGSTSPQGWNNFSGNTNTGTKLNLQAINGENTPIEIELLTDWNGKNSLGYSTSDNSGIYPDNVLEGFYFSSFGSETIRISGLQNGQPYTFDLLGSRTGSGDRSTFYEINNLRLELQTLNNASDVVTFDDIMADDNGQVEILIGKSGSSSYGYLNALAIRTASNNELPAISNPTNPNAAINNLPEGNYQIILEVTDNMGASDIDTVHIEVLQQTINQKPTAIVTVDSVITISNTIELDGTSSTDADGTIQSANWRMVSGPLQAVFSSPDSLFTFAQNLIEGNYVFMLTVYDDQGSGDSTEVALRVNAYNNAPVAKVLADSIVFLPLDTMTLDASTSFDPDGVIETFLWSFESKPSSSESFIVNPNDELATVKQLSAGDHELCLIVVDDAGAKDSAFFAFSVPPIPIANAGEDREIDVQSNLVLEGSSSLIEGDEFSSAQWEIISEPDSVIIENYNFSAPWSSELTGWNLIQSEYDAGSIFDKNLTSLGNITETKLTLLTPWNYSRLQGGSTGSNSGPIPDEVMDGVYWTNSTNEVIQISDLVPLKSYSFAFFSGRAAGGDRTTVFSINDLSDSVNAANNTSNLAQLPNQLADATGTIDVNITKGQEATYGYLNAMILQYDREPTEITDLESLVTSVTGLAVGNYLFKLTITDAYGQTNSDTVQISVQNSEGDSNIRRSKAPNIEVSGKAIIVYPNPATTHIHIIDQSVTDYKIFSMTGTLVKQGVTYELDTSIEVQDLKPGLYLIRVGIDQENGSIPFIKK